MEIKPDPMTAVNIGNKNNVASYYLLYHGDVKQFCEDNSPSRRTAELMAVSREESQRVVVVLVSTSILSTVAFSATAASEDVDDVISCFWR